MRLMPFAAILLAASFAVAQETETTTEATDGAVTLGALEFTTPEGWKQEKPSSNLRVGQFSTPAAEGDEEGGELAIFNFAGGGGQVQANIQRWIGQFDGAGRKVSLTSGKSDQGEYVVADITGTYKKPVGPPILRKTENAEDYRMVAMILNIPEKGVYYLKLTGPQKTIAEQAAALRTAVGADASKEEVLKSAE